LHGATFCKKKSDKADLSAAKKGQLPAYLQAGFLAVFPYENGPFLKRDKQRVADRTLHQPCHS
jgi:hypothetical protein